MDGMSPPSPTEYSSPSKSVSMEMMRRSFYWGSDVEFYFANWPSGHLVMYILALALLLVISVINEYLSNLRGKKAWAGGLVQTLCHTVRVATAYLLMLAVMSYNLGVVAVVIVGSAIGFYLFGRQHAREEESYPTDTESKP
jgi:copper transporter 1